MRRCLVLLPLLVLRGLPADQPVQAQSLPGLRSSAAGPGSPSTGGLSGATFSQSPSIIGGPPGASVGRTPPRVLNPQGLPLRPAGADEPRVKVPSLTPLDLLKPRTAAPPPRSRIEGPPTGITLAEAVQLLIQNNLELRARYSDISQADADVLTAGLRANPIVYADSNGVPYGSYKRAAGPLQYDVNMVYPIDISHKRQTRTRSAVAARLVTEASYRDAVRLTVDGVYKAFVDALTAQTIVAVAADKGDLRSKIPVEEPVSVLEDARRSLALLINVPLAELNGRQLQGQLDFDPDDEPKLPVTDHLVRLAIANRPDLEAQRLVISFAEANVKAVLASRYDDVLLLYPKLRSWRLRNTDFPGNPPAGEARSSLQNPVLTQAFGDLQSQGFQDSFLLGHRSSDST
jgi:outer membrane protein, heavy metal efflux system